MKRGMETETRLGEEKIIYVRLRASSSCRSCHAGGNKRMILEGHPSQHLLFPGPLAGLMQRFCPSPQSSSSPPACRDWPDKAKQRLLGFLWFAGPSKGALWLQHSIPRSSSDRQPVWGPWLEESFQQGPSRLPASDSLNQSVRCPHGRCKHLQVEFSQLGHSSYPISRDLLES